MRIRRSGRRDTGTLEEFRDAVQDRIAELEGDVYPIESATDYESDEFFDKGGDLKYWYFTKHGVMPGSVPRGLNILEVVDRPEGSYFLTDRVITTKALNYYDIKERSPEGITSCDRSVRNEEIESATEVPVVSGESSTFPVDEVISFLDRKGYDTDDEQVKNAADAIAEYMDMSREAYEHNGEPWTYTLEEWYKDTQQNYPEELDLPKKGEYDSIDSACNSCNIMSTADMSLSIEDQEKLYEIADGYVTSNPVSGDWDSELQHEQQAIADALNISLSDAKQAMIQYLGFDEDDFKITAAKNIPGLSEDDIVTYDTVEAADEVDNDAEDIDDSKTAVDDYDKKYLEKIQAKLEEWVEDLKWDKDRGDGTSPIDSITFEDDESNLYATITMNSDGDEDVAIHSYTVPYDDLTFDYDEIDKDVDYIVEAIGEDIDNKDAVESTTAITADETDEFTLNDRYDSEYDSDWVELKSKQIRDSDGFLTDYTLYEWQGDPSDVDDEIYICMYGDKELYGPDPGWADYSTESLEQAEDWFDNYESYNIDDDEIWEE